MLKRFLVIDLYDGNKDLTNIDKWIPIQERLPYSHGIFKVKTSHGIEQIAYYCADKCIPYGDCYWWEKNTKEPLYNVTHWGGNEE